MITTPDIEKAMRTMVRARSDLRKVDGEIGKVVRKRDKFLKKFEKRKNRFLEIMDQYDSLQQNTLPS